MAGERKSKYWDYLFKLIIIGDSFSGKSAILSRLADEDFNGSYLTTVGIDFRIKSILHEGKRIKLQIYDSAGQQRFHSITRSYYRNIDACLLVYDTSDRQSFTNLEHWIGELQQYATKTFIPILVGNKIDLTKVVQTDELKALATKYECKFFEVSAKENIGVEQMFNELIADVYRTKINTPVSSLTEKKNSGADSRGG